MVVVETHNRDDVRVGGGRHNEHADVRALRERVAGKPQRPYRLIELGLIGLHAEYEVEDSLEVGRYERTAGERDHFFPIRSVFLRLG